MQRGLDLQKMREQAKCTKMASRVVVVLISSVLCNVARPGGYEFISFSLRTFEVTEIFKIIESFLWNVNQ